MKREIEIKDITPKELAVEFCELDAKNQALFFEYIGSITKEWNYRFDNQLFEIILQINNYDMHESKRIIQLIQEYAENLK